LKSRIGRIVVALNKTLKTMKKLMTLALMLLVMQSYGQGFEGTVSWSMKMEVTDPKLKAEMERGQQRMSDPANQAKMKEMQEKMKDPRMKAMMESNPQMKAQMENMQKMMAGGGQVLPKSIRIRIKGGNTLTRMEGGMMDGMEMLFLKDKNQTVRLDRANKTYTIMPGGGDDKGNATAAAPKVTKTNETMTILGYACTKYIAEFNEAGVSRSEVIWTTTDIKDFDAKGFGRQRMGQGGRSMFPAGVDGVPLKVEASTKEGNMIMEALEIKREVQNASDFAIPADFKEVKGRF
jgi:hypothetical protein